MNERIGGLLVAGALALGGADAGAVADGKGAKPGSGATAAAPAAGDGERPFIERTLVLAPERAGAMTLTGVHEYEDVRYGVQFRYAHPDIPAARVDVFVYPQGRAVPDDVIAAGMAEVRAAIGQKVDEGVYGDATFGDETAFDLLAVDTDGSPLPPEAVPQVAEFRPADGSAPDPERSGIMGRLVGDPAASQRRYGRRQALRLEMEDTALGSRSFLFYDALYLFKGRISAPAMDLPDESLDRFADRAMADIVPAIVVRNSGSCADRRIAIDPDAPPDEAAVQALVASMLEQAGTANCTPVLDESTPDGYRAVELVFPPGAWN